MLIRLAFAIVLPIVIFLGGAMLMFDLSDRDLVVDQLNVAELSDRTPLYQRGYSKDEVARHWGALKSDGLKAERLFLMMDVVFPLVFGATLLTSLLIFSSLLNRPLQPLWLAAPVVIMVIADWVENLVQIAQLSRYTGGGAAVLQSGWIEVASTATVVKLIFSTGLLLFAVVLVTCVIFRLFNPD